MTGDQVLLNAAITTTATPYTAGDSVGGLIVQFPGQRRPSGTIKDLKMVDTLGQNPALTLFFFSDNPTASTITDNAPFDLHADDAGKYVGAIGVAGVDWITVDSQGFLNVATQVEIFWASAYRQAAAVAPDTMKIWMAIVTGGTPTYGANATSLYVKIGLDTVSK